MISHVVKARAARKPRRTSRTLERNSAAVGLTIVMKCPRAPDIAPGSTPPPVKPPAIRTTARGPPTARFPCASQASFLGSPPPKRCCYLFESRGAPGGASCRHIQSLRERRITFARVRSGSAATASVSAVGIGGLFYQASQLLRWWAHKGSNLDPLIKSQLFYR